MPSLPAVTIAAAAAKVIAERRAAIENLQAVTTTKSSDVDPVTIVDTAAEEVIRTMLTELRPGDGMIGEEGTATTATTAAGSEGAADHQGHEAARQRLATVRPVGRALARRQGRVGVKPAPGAG